MGSLLGVLPSFDPFNFNQLRPSDPSNPCKLMLVTYHSSHSQTPPPPDQVRQRYCCDNWASNRWIQLRN
ncbi:hypothetical protein ES319_D12G258300v1 [Gossypium barbadense]|uniref:DET1- and DDB1-associated protein 1 domain-containing protein n=1 Tax=Gossypium barbadense TaxID=3634 RepID=A0A5J5P316_GOSBA|nr:hypothetical protein ES319_D12G258300v1 [Gossypium barbadense]